MSRGGETFGPICLAHARQNDANVRGMAQPERPIPAPHPLTRGRPEVAAIASRYT